MKYFSPKNTWAKEKENYIRLHREGLDEDFHARVFSIQKHVRSIIFREECDQFFTCTLSPEQAVEMLQEAIDWIKK